MSEPAQARHGSALRAILEVIGLTVLAFVVALVAGIAFIVPLLVLGYNIQATFVLVGSTGVSQLAMFGLGYGYLRYRGLSVPIAVPTKTALGYTLGGLVVALAAATGLSLLLATLGLLPGSVIGDTAAMNPTFLLGLAVLSVVIVAPVEEFLFRGVIQGRLRGRFGPFAAILGSSLLFGSMHLANYTGRLLPIVAGALMIAVVGAIFGALYEWTDNLVVPTIVHASYNVILLLVSYAMTALS